MPAPGVTNGWGTGVRGGGGEGGAARGGWASASRGRSHAAKRRSARQYRPGGAVSGTYGAGGAVLGASPTSRRRSFSIASRAYPAARLASCRAAEAAWRISHVDISRSLL